MGELYKVLGFMGPVAKKAFKILGKYYLDHKENYTYKDMNVFDN